MKKHLNNKIAYLKKYIGDDKNYHTILEPLFTNPELKDKSIYEELSKNKELRGDIRDYLEGLAKTKNALEHIQRGVTHHVLNAKHHEKEAFIVAQAGRKGAITIATNMAGRGTDILLGGNPEFLAKEEISNQGKDWYDIPEEERDALTAEKKKITDVEKEDVIEAGGLHIVGTERHESRRIDNQLRGRAARQGDPGSTRFYLSLQDNLMRIFGGDRVSGLMDMLNVDESMPIAAKMVSNVIEGAQRKVESHHFDIRKNVLKYDDVLTEQRQLIYDQRRQVLEGLNLRENMLHMTEQEMTRLVTGHIPPEGTLEDWEEEPVTDMLAQMHAQFPQLQHIEREQLAGKQQPELLSMLIEEVLNAYERIESQLNEVSGQLKEEHGIELLGLEGELNPADKYLTDKVDALSDEARAHYRHPLRRVERDILLSVIDNKWIDYLHNLDALREGIGLRAYGQKDPLLEYKREAFEMFQALTFDIQREVTSLLYRSKIEIQLEQHAPEGADLEMSGDEAVVES
jgi:preprotein translocase subunit SecA